MVNPAGREGQLLGNYRLIQILGRGNFADVYLAEHIHLNTQAAIKVLHGQLASSEQADFLTEARTIARLRHSHIIQVLDFGVEDTTPFLVMEYAPGGNLRQRHPQGTRLPIYTVVSYVKQVASALQYAHDQKLVHRDIKPENMLLGRNDEILLSDFGIAVVNQTLRPGDRSMQGVRQQDTAGTIAYMAPEQMQAHASPASDQYALGVVVYEWLSGNRPFQGSFPEIAIKHTLAPPPLLSEQVPGLSLALEQVVLKALAKEPERRFERVMDFAMALEQVGLSSVEDQGTDLSGRTVFVPSSSPPPVISNVPLNNLPVQLTPLIGREQEIEAVTAMLQRADIRLVTLTGTGGIGKTRLSLQVASKLLDTFTDGVYFVPLASVSDPAQVIPTVARLLGLNHIYTRGNEVQLPLMEHMQYLKTFLHDKHFLLVLDNFEQAVPSAPDLSELLVACPYLKILVTSRAVLHLHSEHEFPVPPLTIPASAHLPSLSDLSQYSAIALFLQRARAVKPDFDLTRANAQAIADICRLVDGLPLAIELAAARIKLLPPRALLQRLEHPLDVLTGGVQDAPTRQQTLRNTIAWSYHLLDAAEQRVFRRLSVFVGGCTLDAIEAISRTPTQIDDTTRLLDILGSLIDKSLVLQTDHEAEEPRFAMLETIREYARECLAASGEEEITHQAHTAYYLALAERSESELVGPQQMVWLERLEREHDNLRVALHWTIQQGETKAGAGVGAESNIEMALRLAGALRRFWQMHGHLKEGHTFLERVLAVSQGMVISAKARSKALIAAGTLAAVQNDYDHVETYCRQSLALFRELDDQPGMALSLYLLGVVPLMKGDIAAARTLTEEALVLFRQMGDKERIAWSLSTLGYMDSQEGKYDTARLRFEESLAVHRELGDKRGIAASLLRLAQDLFVSQVDHGTQEPSQGRDAPPVGADSSRPAPQRSEAKRVSIPRPIGPNKGETVRSLLEEGLALYRQLGDKDGMANSYSLSGQLALYQGDTAAARTLLEESIKLYREMGHDRGLAESLARLAGVLAAQNEHTAAYSLYEESLAMAKQLNHTWLIAFCLEGMAAEAVADDEFLWAAQLLGTAEQLRRAINVPIPPVERAGYDRLVSTIRTMLGEDVFASAWTWGRAMTSDQVISAQGRDVQVDVGRHPAETGEKQIDSSPSPSSVYPAGLTTREVEVLRFVVRGLTNSEIARELGLSEKTIAHHLTHIFNKTSSDNRAAAAAFAIHHGLA